VGVFSEKYTFRCQGSWSLCHLHIIVHNKSYIMHFWYINDILLGFQQVENKTCVLPKTLSIALFSRPCCCCLSAERSLNYRTAVSYQRNSQKQPKKRWKYKKNKAWSKKGCGSTRAFKYPRPLNRGKERVTHLATGALGASHGHVSTHKVWKNRNLWTVLTTLPLNPLTTGVPHMRHPKK